MPGPLEGVRVVELGMWVAGPAAGGVLADWGADVIKIEPPAGDPARTLAAMYGGDLDSNPPFEMDNRSKRGIMLDLRSEEGRATAAELADTADVFITNMRPEALERLGLDHHTLRARNPRLVYGLITGYGIEGPDAGRPAYDIAAFWARSGLAHLLSQPGEPPPGQRSGMGDHLTGMTLAGAVCAALVARERTGEGQLVATSMFRVGTYSVSIDINTYLMWGLTIGNSKRERMGNPCINNYQAGDGRRFWVVGLEGERHWPPMCRVLGRTDWLDDPRYVDPKSRRDEFGRTHRRDGRHLRHEVAGRVGRGLRRRARLLLGSHEFRGGSRRRRTISHGRRCGVRTRRGRRRDGDGRYSRRLLRHAGRAPLDGACDRAAH